MEQLITHDTMRHKYQAIGHTLVLMPNDRDAALVNFTGAHSAVHGLRDFLLDPNNREHLSNVVWGGDVRVRLPAETVYWYKIAPLPCGLLNCVIAHPGFSGKGLAEAWFTYTLDGRLPDRFTDRLQTSAPIPLLREWTDALWWVLNHPEQYWQDPWECPWQPLHVLGRGHAYQASSDIDAWREVLRRAVPLTRKEVKPWHETPAERNSATTVPPTLSLPSS